MAKMGGRVTAGYSLQAGGLSLEKCADTVRFWLGFEELGSGPRSLWGSEGRGLGYCYCGGRIRCHC